MSEPLLEFIIVFASGTLCFACGYLTAFIVTRARFHNEMIKRGAARYDPEDRQKGMARAAEIEILNVHPPSPRS
jgi:hypothetical protein